MNSAMYFRKDSVFYDGQKRHLDIPTGARAVLRRLGLKLTRISRYPNGSNIYIDLVRYVPAEQLEVVFDVGANVGQTALEYNYYFPNAQIYSFEHAQATFEELTKNTSGISQIHCHRLAMGPREDVVRLNLQVDSTCNSLNPIVQQGKAEHTRPTGASEDVRMMRIDSFCDRQGIKKIDLLKVDAGGFDIEILKGAEKLLEKGRIRFIFAEMTFNPGNRIHCQFSDYVSYLGKFKFVPVAIYDQCIAGDLSKNFYANALFSCGEQSASQ